MRSRSCHRFSLGVALRPRQRAVLPPAPPGVPPRTVTTVSRRRWPPPRSAEAACYSCGYDGPPAPINAKRPHRNWRCGLILGSAPERIRTSDLLLRRQALYPAELRAHRGRRNKPSSVPRRAAARTISLGRPLPTASCSLPGTARIAPLGAGSPSFPIWPCSGWGLPCHACHQTRGALLPHPFTLTCAVRRRPSAVCFLWHFPSPCDARALPGTLPCGARTFLDTWPEPVPRSSLASQNFDFQC